MQSLEELTEQERKRLLDTTLGLDRLILLLLLDTGLKTEELIGLRVSDVDFDGRLLRVSGRSMALSEETLAYLKSYLAARPGQTHLLEGRCGKPITCRWRRCVLDRLLQVGIMRRRIDKHG